MTDPGFSPILAETDFQLIDKIIQTSGQEPDAVIPILLAIQKQFHYLPREALVRITERTKITASAVGGIATFYSQFRMQPAGKHFVEVCTGTACHVKGADRLLHTLDSQLGLAPGEDTDTDRNFTVKKVACLGCCTLAPVVQIDGATHGHVTPQDIPGLLHSALVNPTPHHHPEKISSAPLRDTIGEIRIGLGSCCVAGGSQQVLDSLEHQLAKEKLALPVKTVGCVGMCHRTPLVELKDKEGHTQHYANVSSDLTSAILDRHFPDNRMTNKLQRTAENLFNLLLPVDGQNILDSHALETKSGPARNFLSPQVHIATEHCGVLDPLDFDEYCALGGFKALRVALKRGRPSEIIQSIQDSGLRGRGGGGFPTGKKWALVAAQKSAIKYIICNGDEGDPGAFMDRMLLESYPFRIIEGLLIGAFSVGASVGYFYIRAEYPLAVKRIQAAIDICHEKGLLGKNIAGSGFDFQVEIREGAGAFVCGEETALIKSIAGERGSPELRPPYPAICGLWGQPTLVNNTETFAVIPWIVRNGAKKFSNLGTQSSSGTKVFALAGKIVRGGLIEVPMGITIGEIVEEIGGGIAGERTFKAVQIGGPSGGCIPAELSDLRIDFEALNAAGAMMGSGGLLVMDDGDCMVDIARYFLSFTQNQSCGKCTFCRVGTKRMLSILEKITSGRGTERDLEELETLAHQVKEGSLCGLGRSAPNPILTTLRYFRHEYEEHLQGICSAGKCPDLIQYNITSHCTGCTICAQHCPVDAIPLHPYRMHIINQDLCIKCDTCLQVCPANAVEVIPHD